MLSTNMSTVVNRPPKAVRTGIIVAPYTVPPPSEAVAVAIPFFSCMYNSAMPPQCGTQQCAKDGNDPTVVDEIVVSCLCNPNRSLNALATRTECQTPHGPPVSLYPDIPDIAQWRIATTNLTTCAFSSVPCAKNVCNMQLSHPIQGDMGIFEKLGAASEITNPYSLYHCTADYDTAFAIYNGQYNFTACKPDEIMKCLPPGSFVPNATCEAAASTGTQAATAAQAAQAAASSDAVAPLVSLLAVLLVLVSALGLGLGV